MSNATDNPRIEVLKAGGSGVFTNYIYKAIPLAFDESMSYYETLAGLRDYLEETVIPTVNNNADAVAELQDLYEELNAYVDNYFNNLDVQEEINNKLDDLVEDGTLERLIGAYIDPLIDEQNQEISEFKTSVNGQIAIQNAQIQAVTSGSPLVASSVDQMTDTTRVYVNITDGNWYYYNGTQWTIGGVYQAAEDSESVEMLKSGLSESDNLFNPLTVSNNSNISQSTGDLLDNNNRYATDFIAIDKTLGLYSAPQTANFYFYDENKAFLGYYSTNKARVSGTDIPDGTQYLRCVYDKSVISYENRFNIHLMQWPYHNKYNDIPHFAIGKEYIKAGSLGVGLLNSTLVKGITSANIELGQKPFTLDDLMVASINETTGQVSFENSKRLSTLIYLYCKKGTTISMTNNDYRLYEYNKDTYEYIGILGSWRRTYTFTEDKLVRLTIKKADDTTMTPEERQQLYNEMQIVYVDPLQEFVDDNTHIGTKLEYYGEKVSLKNNCWKSPQLGITTNGQDGAVYNGLVFEVSSSGYFNVTELESKTSLGRFYLDQYETILPHANSVCFGNEFYDENDEFPLLYINAYNNASLPRGTCYIHRVQRDSNNQFSTTLVQTIQIGFTTDPLWTDGNDSRPFGNFAVDTDKNFLYVFTMRDSLKCTRFFKFALPKLADGTNIILAQSDIIEYFDTPYQPLIQGCQYYQNKIFSSCGMNSAVANSSSIRVIDLVSKGEIANIPTSSITNEPETVAFYNNKMVFGGSQLLNIEF